LADRDSILIKRWLFTNYAISLTTGTAGGFLLTMKVAFFF